MQDYSYIIHNATLIDGLGGAAWHGSLAVQGERIARIDTQIEGKSFFELDARGLCLAPGFVCAAPQTTLLEAGDYFAQGITTLITDTRNEAMHQNHLLAPELYFSDAPLETALVQAKASRLPLIHLAPTKTEIEDFNLASKQQAAYFLSATMHSRSLPAFGEAREGFLPFLAAHPLEKAVQRLTSHTAQALGVIGRGELVEGHFADMVLFDPQNLRVSSHFENTFQAIWVNGSLSFSRGKATSAKAGREITRSEMKRLRI